MDYIKNIASSAQIIIDDTGNNDEGTVSHITPFTTSSGTQGWPSPTNYNEDDSEDVENSEALD